MALTVPFFHPDKFQWYQIQTIPNRSFECGHCGRFVSSDRGFRVGAPPNGGGQFATAAWACPNCQGLTFITIYDNQAQIPAPAFGRPVASVPADLTALYEEARRCTTQNCHTAAVLLCRKMLMNIAVQEGASAGLHFVEYVDYLANNGFVPPHGKKWVDHIRQKGNEATHEIALMAAKDAQELIAFVEMLLRFIYEFSAMVP
jgi:hypothetical protein